VTSSITRAISTCTAATTAATDANVKYDATAKQSDY